MVASWSCSVTLVLIGSFCRLLFLVEVLHVCKIIPSGLGKCAARRIFALMFFFFLLVCFLDNIHNCGHNILSLQLMQ